jgi:FkbM family methyltransferase
LNYLKTKIESKDWNAQIAKEWFFKLCKAIREKFQPKRLTWKNIEQHINRIVDYETLRQQFVMLLCPENEIQFPDGSLEVFDRQALWALGNEILYNEDYYFKTDKKCPQIFDLGSNIGLSIYYFKHLYPDSVINAFEPDPDIWAVLKRNIERNKWDSVTLHNFALNANEGYAEFNKNLQKTLAGSLTTRRIGKEKTIPIQVRCKRLSEYLTEPVDYLKIDVEGVEELVLGDIQNHLSKVDRIFCEYHQGENLPADRFLRIISLLEENRFAYRIAPSTLYDHQYRPMQQVGIPHTTLIWACRRDIL